MSGFLRDRHAFDLAVRVLPLQSWRARRRAENQAMPWASMAVTAARCVTRINPLPRAFRFTPGLSTCRSSFEGNIVKTLLFTMTAALAILAFPLGAYAAVPQQEHAHEHAHEHPAAAAVPAQRWTPDAPLREGMRRARAAVDRLQGIESGQASRQGVEKQAAAVEAAVVYMFSNCKLAAEPDAALHSILVPLLSEAQALKADPAKAGAVAKMRAQIARYALYFDDPGWGDARPHGSARAVGR